MASNVARPLIGCLKGAMGLPWRSPVRIFCWTQGIQPTKRHALWFEDFQ